MGIADNPRNTLDKMMFAGIENHMLFGGSDMPEPQKTDIECFVCGPLDEGDEYQVFTNDLSDREIIICEVCQSVAKYKTAEMPINESEED